MEDVRDAEIKAGNLHGAKTIESEIRHARKELEHAKELVLTKQGLIELLELYGRMIRTTSEAPNQNFDRPMSRLKLEFYPR